MKRPHILIFGRFAKGTLGASYLRAFSQLDCVVDTLEQDDLAPRLTLGGQQRVIHRLTLRNLPYRRLAARRWNTHLIAHVRHVAPDLLFILKGDWVMPETVRAIQALGTRVFVFHPDSPFPTSGNFRAETLVTAKEVDAYFIWSRMLQVQLQGMGVARVVYLPFGWECELFPYDGVNSAEYQVVFVGGWDKPREKVLTYVAKNFDLKIWGPDYWATRTQRNSPLKQCWQGRSVRSHEASQILSRATVALNILRQQNLPDGTNMRTFEQAGCGALTVATASSGAQELFPAGDAAIYYETPEDCLQKIADCVVHPARRHKMIAHAQHIVSTHHQYQHRAETVLRVLREM